MHGEAADAPVNPIICGLAGDATSRAPAHVPGKDALAMKSSRSSSVRKRMQPNYDAVVTQPVTFCRDHLNDDTGTLRGGARYPLS